MLIVSPVASGNGAHVVHKSLERLIEEYQVCSFNPYRTVFPLALFPVGRELKASIIHTTPDYAPFHRRKGIPLVLTFHNYVLDKYMRLYSSMLQNIHYQTDLKWFTNQAIRIADEVTAVSQFTANLVEKEIGTERPIRVIYNGVDESVFKPSNEFISLKKGIKVLYSGNLTERKGVQWLLPILEKLNSHVSIMYTSGLRGSGELSSHPRFINVGKVPYKDMPKLCQSADILLFPTVREGLPLAVLEAMSCGLPVVATNCSSLPELIDNGKGGFLCGLGDVDDFANKINLLAENDGLRKEMGEYNRVKVEELFTLNRMVSEYKSLFERLL